VIKFSDGVLSKCKPELPLGCTLGRVDQAELKLTRRRPDSKRRKSEDKSST
jgi:hypothetical protein